MKVGDLVKPMGACSGPPGGIRCQTALVIGVYGDSERDARTARIACPCGVSDQYHHTLELIKGVNQHDL